jgi:hypothetical protein
MPRTGDLLLDEYVKDEATTADMSSAESADSETSVAGNPVP